MRINNHLIADIKFLESPNFNTRPTGTSINLLVIHSISLPPKVYGSNHIENFFLNKLDHSLDPFYEEIKELKVSTHLLIKERWRNYSVRSFQYESLARR
jgi:AmpD protein